jgi:RimK family alpha-L-glutamate ligase
MKIAIIHSIDGERYAQLIASELKKRGTEAFVAPWTYFLPLNTETRLSQWDLIHVRFGGVKTSLYVIKNLATQNVPIVNSPSCAEYSSNKFLGMLLAEKAQVPVPRSFYVDSYTLAKGEIPRTEFPVIAKPFFSSQGTDVFKIETRTQLEGNIGKLLSKYDGIIVQEFLQYSKLIRVILVGDEVIDAAFEIPKNTWKTSVCLNANVKQYPLNDKLTDICFRLKEAFGGEILTIDLFETKDGQYVFNEINNACNLYKMSLATKVDHAKKIGEYLLRKATK